jgi:hypothetical protein
MEVARDGKKEGTRSMTLELASFLSRKSDQDDGYVILLRAVSVV